MNITDKQMLAGVADVQEGCRERLCNECTLYTAGLSCGVARSNPVCWTVPALTADPKPAEPDEPYLCKLFGVGVGERFDVLRADGSGQLENVWVAENGVFYVVSAENEACSDMVETWAFADLIEIAAKHPALIRRKPKVVLSEDDKVIVRRLLQNGLTWAAVNVSATKNVTLFSDKPSVDKGIFRDRRVGFAGKPFPTMLLPWATHEGSPYYLPDLVEGG